MKTFRVKIDNTQDSVNVTISLLKKHKEKFMISYHLFPSDDDCVYIVASVDSEEDLPKTLCGWHQLHCI